MTLDKAIEILTISLNFTGKDLNPNLKTAMELGIEALKQVKWLHESQVLYENDLLPGETKD